MLRGIDTRGGDGPAGRFGEIFGNRRDDGSDVGEENKGKLERLW